MIEKKGSAEVMREDTELSSEYIFLGLRLEKGIDLSDFAMRFGFDLVEKYKAEIARLTEAGLIETEEECLRLTRRGKLFSNEVFSVFV